MHINFNPNLLVFSGGVHRHGELKRLTWIYHILLDEKKCIYNSLLCSAGGPQSIMLNPVSNFTDDRLDEYGFYQFPLFLYSMIYSYATGSSESGKRSKVKKLEQTLQGFIKAIAPPFAAYHWPSSFIVYTLPLPLLPPPTAASPLLMPAVSLEPEKDQQFYFEMGVVTPC